MAVYDTRSPFLGGSGAAVPHYEWVGNQLVSNAYRSAYRTGESPYTREYQQVIATRSGAGVSWTTMPNSETMSAAGVDPAATFQYGGQNYRLLGGRATPVNEQGQTLSTGLMSDWQSAYDEAKRANEERYQQILTGLEGSGAQERKDISSAYRSMEGQGVQDLVSRGLSGTTLLPSMRMGVANQEVAAQGRLEQRLRDEKFGFMERRQDTYPDITPYLNLLMQYGNATGGMGATSGRISAGGSSYAARQTVPTTGRPMAGQPYVPSVANPFGNPYIF